jgi:hypothetical protein
MFPPPFLFLSPAPFNAPLINDGGAIDSEDPMVLSDEFGHTNCP